MSWIATAVIGGSVIGGLTQDRAARRATEAQVEASDAAIREQRAARAELRRLLRPFTEAGTASLSELGALSGAGTPEEEGAAIGRVESSPEFQALLEQAEEGILSSGAATGQLRGGNIREALASVRPSILSSLIDRRFGRLMGLTQIGQSSAAGQGTAALQTGGNIGNILLNRGEAIGQGELARGRAFGNIGSSLSTIGLLSNPAAGFGRF